MPILLELAARMPNTQMRNLAIALGWWFLLPADKSPTAAVTGSPTLRVGD